MGKKRRHTARLRQREGSYEEPSTAWALSLLLNVNEMKWNEMKWNEMNKPHLKGLQ